MLTTYFMQNPWPLKVTGDLALLILMPHPAMPPNAELKPHIIPS